MKMKLNSYTIIIFVCICFGCKSNTSEKDHYSENVKSISSSTAVILNMEGQTFTMNQNELNPQQKLDFENNDLQYVVYTNESVVSINFNLKGSETLTKIPRTYTIPDANEGAVIIDLSFFNNDRKVEKRSNKRVVFRSGTITISELTKSKLVMHFEGKGNGMTERSDTLFPISGSIHITY